MAQQLELFAGAHVPLARCLTALEEDDLHAAREALAAAAPDTGAELDRRRLAAIVAAAGTVSADGVHAAFEAALTADSPHSRPGEIPVAVWFRLYARRMAAALDVGPFRRFRGWYALHFMLAAGHFDAALRAGQRLVATCPEGQAWLEAARAAWAASQAESMARWVVLACLNSRDALDPTPRRIAVSGIPGLDPPPGALPRFAPAIENLWDAVEALDLPGPASTWVPAVGMIDGVFAPSLFGWSDDLEQAGLDPADSAPRAFVLALLAARHARATSAPSARTECSQAELAARLDMKRLAPQLLARYLARLDIAPGGA